MAKYTFKGVKFEGDADQSVFFDTQDCSLVSFSFGSKNKIQQNETKQKVKFFHNGKDSLEIQIGLKFINKDSRRNISLVKQEKIFGLLLALHSKNINKVGLLLDDKEDESKMVNILEFFMEFLNINNVNPISTFPTIDIVASDIRNGSFGEHFLQLNCVLERRDI